MNNNPNTVKQDIVQLILRWKLSTAEVQLQKDQAILSEEIRSELKSLLEQYRGYDKIMFSAQENCSSPTHPTARSAPGSRRTTTIPGSKPHSKNAATPNAISAANSTR